MDSLAKTSYWIKVSIPQSIGCMNKFDFRGGMNVVSDERAQCKITLQRRHYDSDVQQGEYLLPEVLIALSDSF
jgi:hypothetical protein